MQRHTGNLFRSLMLPLALACAPGCGGGPGPDSPAGTSAGGAQGTAANPVQAGTTAGPIVGGSGGGVTHFLGVPYAAPPVGPLRFRPPVPHAPWTRALDASKVGPSCPQAGTTGSDEDCLTLNLWTTRMDRSAHLPVMVFIHGGSFTSGSGGLSLYDGTNIAQKGQVVVVTINYRLGPLGFLAHPSLIAEDPHGSAGNYGLLDQQMALHWVQSNIEGFGGDPGNVTIFGESAGAASVSAHLASPLAQGLFHRAITESGAILLGVPPLLDDPNDSMESAVALGKRVAAALSCDTAADVAACLRGKTPAQLLSVPVTPAPGDLHAAVYWPNRDGWVLPLNIKDAFKNGQVQHVPLLAGVNKDEGTLFTLDIQVATRSDLEQLLRSVMPAHADQILALYPESRYPDPKAALTAFYGDYAFNCHVRLQSRLYGSGQQRVYLYQFTRGNLTTALLGLGVTHALELPFVFHNFAWPFIGDLGDQFLSDQMIGYWTHFAAAGDPNAFLLPNWPTMGDALNYQVLDVPVRTDNHFKSDVCDVIEPWILAL